MKFFSSIWKSVYDVKWYETEGIKFTFRRAVWRYMRLAALLMLIGGIVFIIPLGLVFTSDKLVEWTGKGIAIVKQAYPSDLMVDISQASGVVTNTTGPVYFPVSVFSQLSPNEKRWDEDAYDNNHKKNILVIDTAATPDMISTYSTYILITKNSIASMGGTNGEIKMYSIADMMKNSTGTVHITSGVVENFLSTANDNVVKNKDQIVGVVYTVAIVTMLIMLTVGAFFIGLGTAIILYFYTLAVWAVSGILKTKYTYKQIYSYTVAGYTLPFILGIVWIGAIRHIGFDLRRWTKVILLCLIVGRVLYIIKSRNNQSSNHADGIRQSEQNSITHAEYHNNEHTHTEE